MSAIGMGPGDALPAGLNPMRLIDASTVIPDPIKYLILGIGIFLWFAMTAGIVFRAVAGGMKMWYEGKAKLEEAKIVRCTFPVCRYNTYKEAVEKELQISKNIHKN